MQRSDRFLISKQPYAVNLTTYNTREEYARYASSKKVADKPTYWMTVEAVWFRRKSGALSAHYGRLWDVSSTKPESVTSWLEGLTDGRYGGSCVARWNGQDMWAPEVDWDRQVQLQKVLAQMLDGYPAVPEGYEGWWTFK